MMNIDVDSRSSRQAADARGLPRPIILMTPDITGAGNAGIRAISTATPYEVWRESASTARALACRMYRRASSI